MIATTPLSAIYFGTVSLAGILTNLLTLWVVAFVFYGIMLACVAALIFLPVAKAIAWVIAWPIRYIMAVASLLAKLPFIWQTELIKCSFLRNHSSKQRKC